MLPLLRPLPPPLWSAASMVRHLEDFSTSKDRCRPHRLARPPRKTASTVTTVVPPPCSTASVVTSTPTPSPSNFVVEALSLSELGCKGVAGKLAIWQKRGNTVENLIAGLTPVDVDVGVIGASSSSVVVGAHEAGGVQNRMSSATDGVVIVLE